MGSKMGATLGILIVVILIGFAIVSFNNISESSEESIKEQNTDGSIQEQLMDEE